MCFVRLSCLAWSFVNLTDGTSECRLADAGPSGHLVENNTDAVYFFLQGETNPPTDFPPCNERGCIREHPGETLICNPCNQHPKEKYDECRSTTYARGREVDYLRPFRHIKETKLNGHIDDGRSPNPLPNVSKKHMQTCIQPAALLTTHVQWSGNTLFGSPINPVLAKTF